MKRFFCSLFQTFSLDFLDLRQTFWQVVWTVKKIIQSSFWGIFFRGFSSIFVYLYLNIQQKALFLTKFHRMIIKSALHVSKGTVLESFVIYENSTFCSNFWGETKKLCRNSVKIFSAASKLHSTWPERNFADIDFFGKTTKYR